MKFKLDQIVYAIQITTVAGETVGFDIRVGVIKGIYKNTDKTFDYTILFNVWGSGHGTWKEDEIYKNLNKARAVVKKKLRELHKKRIEALDNNVMVLKKQGKNSPYLKQYLK